MSSIKKEVNYQVYQDIIKLTLYFKHQLSEASQICKLTSVQSMMLLALRPEKPSNMHDLAKLMVCDASNVTGLANRMQTLGLIELQVDPSDRRVRRMNLTTEGVRCRNEIIDNLNNVSYSAKNLSKHELELLSKMANNVGI